jgi:hypothetical protein
MSRIEHGELPFLCTAVDMELTYNNNNKNKAMSSSLLPPYEFIGLDTNSRFSKITRD